VRIVRVVKQVPDVKVRMAQLDDCEAITSVHCSGVTRWVRHVGNAEVDDVYEDLGLLDRYLTGGPWMSFETCVSYIGFLLAAGQYPLVAEVNGKIVGEIEVFIGEEPLPLGKNACISVLEVAKDCRRRGVGRALVSEAIRLAEEQECRFIVTSPEQNAVRFYEKCGLNETLMELKNAEIDLETSSSVSDTRPDVHTLNYYDDLRSMHIVFGEWDGSFAQWLKRQWKFEGWAPSTIVEEAFIPLHEAAYRIESHPRDKSVCNLLAWIKETSNSGSVFDMCLGRAKRLGFRRLQTIVSTKLLDAFCRIPFSLGSSEIILGRRLTTDSSVKSALMM
jgi:GNAT superfamily N-acetyltransferase